MPYSASSGYGAHWRFEDHKRSLKVIRSGAESSSRILSEPLDYDTRSLRPSVIALLS